MVRKPSIQKELELAIATLDERYTHLLVEYQSVRQLFVSSAKAIESRRAIHQSKEVNALTKLAFTIIPGSFLAAIISMGVQEYREQFPSHLDLFRSCSTCNGILLDDEHACGKEACIESPAFSQRSTHLDATDTRK